MARIRTIKPEFFRHSGLYQAEKETKLPLRIAFAGLWTAADREGRFKWDPQNLKLDCLPYDDVDFSRVLDALKTRGWIGFFTTSEGEFGFIPSWSRHQVINNKERSSIIPDPFDTSLVIDREVIACPTRAPRVGGDGKGEGKGREGEQGMEGNTASPVAQGATVPPLVSLPLSGKGHHPERNISQADVDSWAALYPAVDVLAECRKMAGWVQASPDRRKTARGVDRFIHRWLAKAQDQGKGNGSGNGRPKSKQQADSDYFKGRIREELGRADQSPASPDDPDRDIPF